MEKLREEFDADRIESIPQATDYPTGQNRFEVSCDMCREVFFVDEATFAKVGDALRKGFDNPFICDDCRDEADELAYS